MPGKRGCLRRILKGLGLLSVLFFVGCPTADLLRTRLAISSALRSPSSIRLERRDLVNPPTTSPVSADEIRDALPFAVDVGIPGLMAMCFIPHHRVVITDAATHRDRIFEVCFHCDQMQFAGRGIRFTPFLWREPLRKLGMAIRVDVPRPAGRGRSPGPGK